MQCPFDKIKNWVNFISDLRNFRGIPHRKWINGSLEGRVLSDFGRPLTVCVLWPCFQFYIASIKMGIYFLIYYLSCAALIFFKFRRHPNIEVTQTFSDPHGKNVKNLNIALIFPKVCKNRKK